MTALSRQYIEDKDVIARYLAGQLSDREREDFEALLVENPELLREVDRTARFKSGLMSLNESGQLQKLLVAKPWWRSNVTLALAASFVLAVIGASVWFRISIAPRPILAASIESLDGRFQSPAIIGTYTIQRTRSSSYDATIELGGRAIELRVKPETAAAPPRYRVSLGVYSNSPFQPVATVASLQPAADGFVSIYLDLTRLTPAIYELRISGDEDTSAKKSESSFLIEVANSTK